MVFLNINVASMFAIILLSLKGIFSPNLRVGNSSFSTSSAFTPYNPSISKERDIPPEVLETYKKRANCKTELNINFKDRESPRDYIKFAIKNLKLSYFLSPNFEYMKQYYMSFSNYMEQGNVPTIEDFCVQANTYKSFPDLMAHVAALVLCERQINAFIYKQGGGVLDNALYYINLSEAEEQKFLVKIYFQIITEAFGLNETPNNVEPFKKPEEFCKWLIKMDDEFQEYDFDLELRL